MAASPAARGLLQKLGRRRPRPRRQQQQGAGTPLMKRLSFGREKKAKPATPKPAAEAAAPPPKPPRKDGEMDDDELEAYLRNLELTHEQEMDAFARANEGETRARPRRRGRRRPPLLYAAPLGRPVLSVAPHRDIGFFAQPDAARVARYTPVTVSASV